VTPIFLWWGWRAAFWFTGFIGLAWLAVWSVVSRRKDVAGTPLDRTKLPVPLGPPMWAFMSAYALGALPLGFVLYSAALYLAHPLGCSQEFIGKVLWIPPLGWEVGYFFWGWMVDRQVGSIAKLMTACVILNLLFALIPLLSNVAAVMFLMFVAMFVASGFVVLSVAYATRIYSADHAGLLAGAGAGSWSAVVAVIMPYFGRLFDQHRYGGAFWIAAGIPIAGYFGWIWLSRLNCTVGFTTNG
jgi:ACS family hexuronate transporter-like MFS transporter